ncbi:MAG: radical SAM protein [Dehalococcoidales bacterium]|nr:MAG: radical SAM protein [Dehalococcoidales bacterium]
MQKVTLVNPPQFSDYPQPPMGLILLAAVLETKGYRVNIVDANFLGLKPADIVPLLDDTDILGLTAMTPTVSRAIDIAREVKSTKPDLPVIMGGPHATLLPTETMAVAPEVDIIVRGEGEESFISLLSVLEDKKPLENVPGITYRKASVVVNNPPSQEISDLDSLPFLAYHLLPLKSYRPHPPHGRALPFAVLITSRGCPYNCGYCSKPVFGKRFRGQSPARIADEIVWLQEQYGVREIAFYDDSFTLDMDRAYQIAEEIISRKLDIIWSCETRVNLVDERLLKKMKQSGCYSISYGLESGSQKILDVIDKGTTLEQAVTAVRYTREAGIHAIGYFMIGSPGETPDTIRETIQFAKTLKVDFAQFSITTPFPGTRLYDLYLEGGGNPDIPWEDYVYAASSEGSAPVFESDSLNREDIIWWESHAYREFYLRPSYIWQRLLSCTSPGDIKVNLNGLSMLLDSIRTKKKK